MISMKFAVTVVMSLKAIVNAELVTSIHVVVVVDVIVIRANAVMNVERRIVAVAVDVTVIHANAVMNVERQIAVVEGVIHIHVNVVIVAVNRIDIVDAIDRETPSCDGVLFI